jgi:hypothetical protein
LLHVDLAHCGADLLAWQPVSSPISAAAEPTHHGLLVAELIHPHIVVHRLQSKLSSSLAAITSSASSSVVMAPSGHPIFLPPRPGTSHGGDSFIVLPLFVQFMVAGSVGFPSYFHSFGPGTWASILSMRAGPCVFRSVIFSLSLLAFISCILSLDLFLISATSIRAQFIS